ALVREDTVVVVFPVPIERIDEFGVAILGKIVEPICPVHSVAPPRTVITGIRALHRATTLFTQRRFDRQRSNTLLNLLLRALTSLFLGQRPHLFPFPRRSCSILGITCAAARGHHEQTTENPDDTSQSDTARDTRSQDDSLPTTTRDIVLSDLESGSQYWECASTDVPPGPDPSYPGSDSKVSAPKLS